MNEGFDVASALSEFRDGCERVSAPGGLAPGF